MVDIIDNPPPTGLVDSRQLPATMQLLSGYSEKLGYKPMGSVTGRKSRAYVGIQTIY